ncbi:hypothetical protein VitviT2T_005885 [Vitis vinifera]|uniref:Cellulase n=1 Tax=Vitis vinifera TaxID=29760 RepID=A0ABY9BU83_VITVI|nr:hypothetical protein VitviT2T_005885 [Vitis vinifera]
MKWRVDSGLHDGKARGWICIVEYERQMSANGELGHAMEVVKWGTDYLIKAHSYSYVFYGFGFLDTYPHYDKLKRESQCVYRPYCCPYAGPECTIISDIPCLATHLKDD